MANLLIKRLIVAAAVAIVLSNTPVLAAEDLSVGALAARVLSDDPTERAEALAALTARSQPDVVPALIQVLRFVPDGAAIDAAIAKLTGEASGKSWGQWMLWQQAHPEIRPFEGFDGFKADVMAAIDPNFRDFLGQGIEHEIRLEEIVWGGVVKDGIPALTNPMHVTPEEATYITDDELVFGVVINGDSRAYPLRIMDWHEMFNDVVGGQPVSLAYCTLCGSGILYKTDIEGRQKPLVFGSSRFPLSLQQADVRPGNQQSLEPVHGPACSRRTYRIGHRARGHAGCDHVMVELARPTPRDQGALPRHRP